MLSHVFGRTISRLPTTAHVKLSKLAYALSPLRYHYLHGIVMGLLT
jgi:hypothetical protein